MPTASARAAQQAARYLLEHYSHTRPTWQVNPDAALSNVVVFGCRRPPAGEHLLDHQAHAFTLAAGTPLPPVWAALCGRQVEPRCSRPSTTVWANRARRAGSAGPQATNQPTLPSCPPGPRTDMARQLMTIDDLTVIRDRGNSR